MVSTPKSPLRLKVACIFLFYVWQKEAQNIVSERLSPVFVALNFLWFYRNNYSSDLLIGCDRWEIWTYKSSYLSFCFARVLFKTNLNITVHTFPRIWKYLPDFCFSIYFFVCFVCFKNWCYVCHEVMPFVDAPKRKYIVIL